jgi:hypothetical protein
MCGNLPKQLSFLSITNQLDEFLEPHIDGVVLHTSPSPRPTPSSPLARLTPPAAPRGSTKTLQMIWSSLPYKSMFLIANK